MTRDTTRPADGGLGLSLHEIDLLAGLWEEAPFARLPLDAPPELRDLVDDIDNPKRVYAIHRASRRHNFQLLVQKYVVQLRDGCGADFCTTPTCFTCRKRIVGRAPIRRYNTTSARTLAVYLASQDNPENGLCPSLRLPKSPPAALSSLVFTPIQKPPSFRDERAPTAHRPQNGTSRERVPRARRGPDKDGHTRSPPRSRSGSRARAAAEERQGAQARPSAPPAAAPLAFSVSERPVRKDYRSFAANVFGTVAFKMLEWLTPAGVEEMSRQTREFRLGPRPGEDGDSLEPGRDRKGQVPSLSPRSMSTEDLPALGDKLSPKATLPTAVSSPTEIQKGGMDSSLDDSALDQDLNGQQRQQQSQHQQQPSRTLGGGPSRSNDPRRNSTARVRTSSGPKPKRKSSIDPFLQDGVSDDPLPALLRSPRHAPQNEKQPPVLKASAANGSVSRPISQLTTAGYFDAVSLEKMPPSKPAEPKSAVGVVQTDGSTTDERASPRSFETGIRIVSDGSSSDRSSQGADVELGTDVDWQPPQALSRLDADIVDFICDVLQDTNGCEKHGLEPPAVRRLHTTGTSHNRILRRRKSQKRQRGAPGLDAEWRLFIEQSIFYVLSDARLAVRSFMRDGSLYDSQSLWYCMLRMTRVRPSLVFHSLWMAAASLFAPPKSVQSLRSPTARLFPKLERSLSNAEAGCLLSICLHALVAAAPLVSDQQQLLDMSRIRSHGLSLAGSGAIARQPASLCLQYDEAFSNELALRLARRLFAAITARRSYDELTDLNSPDGRGQEPDVLAPLFSQLDFLNMDAVYVLNFSVSDRALHETRVPTLLLDWARAVMLHDWEGHPEVPGDGPFGGALTLMEAMYKNRHALLLGDAQFRCEYFAERLDTVEMPVSWLSQTSSKQKVHLLDYPFIFNPSTLVSYFRAINFSRMSRAFEESSSLQSRMSAIMLPGSLLTNTHHKNILQDMLSTASSKYLILDIDREHVLKNALDQLWRREERELLRPLKVHLGEEGGEEGFDSGGVQQEFFRLAIAEALNPDYGAFTVDERTRMAWFLPGSLEPDWKFELIGLLVSLAVYNGLTLPVTFPKALYRKLLGEPVTDLHHIEDGWPELASGLTSLLEWDEKDGLVEDVFARTYEFSVSVFGVHVSREMKPPTSDESWPRFPAPTWQGSRTPDAGNPGDPPLVTRENRDAYVSDYIRYLTDVSVRPQYEAFARGFRSCLHPKSLTLLNSNLLQSLVEGVQQIDIGELRRHARYVGWDASHRTVRDFWSIVKRYDDAMKRKLLEFVTASDRVPVSGMKNLQFVLQRNGIEEDENGHLPTAYTCYGTLLLPEYRDKEVLRERLAMALENAQGFGFA